MIYSFDCWGEALKQWIKQNYNTETFGRPSWKTLLRDIAEVDKLLFKRLAIEHSSMIKSKLLYTLIRDCKGVAHVKGITLLIQFFFY